MRIARRISRLQQRNQQRALIEVVPPFGKQRGCRSVPRAEQGGIFHVVEDILVDFARIVVQRPRQRLNFRRDLHFVGIDTQWQGIAATVRFKPVVGSNRVRRFDLASGNEGGIVRVCHFAERDRRQDQQPENQMRKSMLHGHFPSS